MLAPEQPDEAAGHLLGIAVVEAGDPELRGGVLRHGLVATREICSPGGSDELLEGIAQCLDQVDGRAGRRLEGEPGRRRDFQILDQQPRSEKAAGDSSDGRDLAPGGFGDAGEMGLKLGPGGEELPVHLQHPFRLRLGQPVGLLEERENFIARLEIQRSGRGGIGQQPVAVHCGDEDGRQNRSWNERMTLCGWTCHVG